jgi:hypothetical protein
VLSTERRAFLTAVLLAVSRFPQRDRYDVSRFARRSPLTARWRAALRTTSATAVAVATNAMRATPFAVGSGRSAVITTVAFRPETNSQYRSRGGCRTNPISSRGTPTSGTLTPNGFNILWRHHARTDSCDSLRAGNMRSLFARLNESRVATQFDCAACRIIVKDDSRYSTETKPLDSYSLRAGLPLLTLRLIARYP